MDTILDRYGSQFDGPKYKALAEAIKGAIQASELAVGVKLPPVRELAWNLKITPGTVARAYSILTDAGFLEAVVGRGTFVADRTEQPKPKSKPGFIEFVSQDADFVSLSSPKLPDMGQVAVIKECLAKLGERPADELLNYPSRKSFAPARSAVLGWLRGAPIGPVDHEDLVLSHGAQNGNTLVMQAVLKGARPVVALEELSYAGFRRAAELLRADVVSVPMDEFGIVPESLEKIVKQTGAQLLCTSPEVHNPTGLFTPTERRIAIARVAERTNLHILEDDCYGIGRAQAPSYRALLPDQGWYVSSISKSLTPSLRVGFAIAPQKHRSDLVRVAEHGFFGLARPLANLVEDLLGRDDIFDLSERVREEMNRYVYAAVNILGGYDLVWAEGMPLLWLRLPQGWRAGAFSLAAEANGVAIRTADEFALRDARVPHAVRLSVNCQVSLRSFEAALTRLRTLLDNPPEQISI